MAGLNKSNEPEKEINVEEEQYVRQQERGIQDTSDIMTGLIIIKNIEIEYYRGERNHKGY